MIVPYADSASTTVDANGNATLDIPPLALGMAAVGSIAIVSPTGIPPLAVWTLLVGGLNLGSFSPFAMVQNVFTTPNQQISITVTNLTAGDTVTATISGYQGRLDEIAPVSPASAPTITLVAGQTAGGGLIKALLTDSNGALYDAVDSGGGYHLLASDTDGGLFVCFDGSSHQTIASDAEGHVGLQGPTDAVRVTGSTSGTLLSAATTGLWRLWSLDVAAVSATSNDYVQLFVGGGEAAVGRVSASTTNNAGQSITIPLGGFLTSEAVTYTTVEGAELILRYSNPGR